MLLVFGPGAALCGPDLLWWADLPKRYAEQAITRGELPLGANLGRPDVPGELRSLFYTDWPVCDRHRDALAHRIDRWIDLQNEQDPASLDGAAVRATFAELATGPVRTRPYFNSTPWGGQWGVRELGFVPQNGNTALGYELIAPEAGVLVGQDEAAQVELPFQLLCELHPGNSSAPRSTAASARPSPSASTTSTPWAAAISLCISTRRSSTCGRRSAGPTPSTRRTT